MWENIKFTYSFFYLYVISLLCARVSVFSRCMVRGKRKNNVETMAGVREIIFFDGCGCYPVNFLVGLRGASAGVDRIKK